MSTKPGIPDHFSIHDVRDAAVGSPPAGGGTATRAQLHAMRDLSIPFDLDHPPTFDDAARLIREAEEVENPIRVVMGPPVRDIREAMHPAEDLADRMKAGVVRAFADLAPRTDLNAPHVATLPDGSRLNLPAGTVLREGEEAIPEHPVIALVRSFVGKPGEGPEVNIEPLPPHLAALLAEHPRWSIADAERSIVDTTEGRDPPK